jgi:hypothetical protein
MSSDLAQSINTAIIDCLLSSKLNIKAIPEDVEKEMLMDILKILESQQVENCIITSLKKFWNWMTNCKSCCKSSHKSSHKS